MYKITKEFSFCASHSLENLPANHPCSKLHGHNYIVIVELESATLNREGFVIDYRKLNLFKAFVDDHLDHRHLNDVVDCNPTAENLAKYMFEIFKKTYSQLVAVTIKETPKTAARYEPIYDEGSKK